jgi:hypothetical protein
MSSGALAELRKATNSFMTSVCLSPFITAPEILFGEIFEMFPVYSSVSKSAKKKKALLEDHVGCRSERPA